jgi:hypothetical protein
VHWVGDTAALPHMLTLTDLSSFAGVLKCGCLNRFMLELGKVVPVVPVVMKADTMTIREALSYRQEVYDKIRAVKYESRVGALTLLLLSLVGLLSVTVPEVE